MDENSPAASEPALASDLVKYLRMRTEAEQFRKGNPKLDRIVERLFEEGRLTSELRFLKWDIPTL